jgi:hypothetical protein
MLVVMTPKRVRPKVRQQGSPSKEVLKYEYPLTHSPRICHLVHASFNSSLQSLFLNSFDTFLSLFEFNQPPTHPFSVARAACLEKSISLPKNVEMRPSLLFVTFRFLLANTNADVFPNPCKRSTDPSDSNVKAKVVAGSSEPQLSARFIPLLVRRAFRQAFADRGIWCVIGCSCLTQVCSRERRAKSEGSEASRAQTTRCAIVPYHVRSIWNVRL